jgi:hypothetical protein
MMAQARDQDRLAAAQARTHAHGPLTYTPGASAQKLDRSYLGPPIGEKKVTGQGAALLLSPMDPS